MKKVLLSLIGLLMVCNLVGCKKISINIPFLKKTPKATQTEQVAQTAPVQNPVLDVLNKVDGLEKFNDVDYIAEYNYGEEKDVFVVDNTYTKVIEGDIIQVRCEARGHLASHPNQTLIIEVPYTDRYEKYDEIDISYHYAEDFDTGDTIITDIIIHEEPIVENIATDSELDEEETEEVELDSSSLEEGEEEIAIDTKS